MPQQTSLGCYLCCDFFQVGLDWPPSLGEPAPTGIAGGIVTDASLKGDEMETDTAGTTEGVVS